MKTQFAKLTITAVFLTTVLSGQVTAQSAKAQASLNEVMEKRVPDAKARLAETDPKLGQIDFTLDTVSFGDKDGEIDYAANEIDNAREAINTLANRSNAQKNALVNKLKKVTLRLVDSKAKRGASFKNGELLLTSESFENDYLSANDITDVLDKGL